LIVIMLPLVAPTTQSASYVFAKVNISSDSTGITSPVYSVILAWLVSQYSLYGYDAAAHLTEETRNADRNGPLAILSSIGMISIFGWAFILALTFSIQVGTHSLLNCTQGLVLLCFILLRRILYVRLSFVEKQLWVFLL
jgi:amino acid transporter